MADIQYTDTLTIRDVLSKDRYLIPLYQRNFAWGDTEVDLLLRDIFENNNDNYYIGTLVVSEIEIAGKKYFEVIDGQQRLTAINIIYSVLTRIISDSKKYPLNLSFESREKSNSALKLLRERGSLDSVTDGSLDNFISAVRTVEKFVKEALNDDKRKTYDYLVNRFLNVCIFKVRLHESTDKNHYFEVMNNRGEQLESHEIVKAKMMDSLANEGERKVFATIWDACSEMNARLENNESVKILWGNHLSQDPLELDRFERIADALKINIVSGENLPEQSSVTNDFSIVKIKSYQRSKANPQETKLQDKLEEKYYSVINFPNFLLQVLEVGHFKDKVRMDAGKFLLQEFGCIGDVKLPNAKGFIVKLLRLKILFDKYIIKRKKTDKTSRGWKWAIEKPAYKDKQYVVNTFDKDPIDAEEIDDIEEMPTASKQMCMLQAMFFVTFRRDVYMRWLTKALSDIDEHPDGSNLLRTLLEYSVSFIKESRDSDGVERNEYKKNLAIHHYVFNFLDYHLWYLYYCKVNNIPNPDIEKYPEIANMLERKGVREGFKYFIFTRRNSIEHYLAQEKGKFRGIPERVINDFGNLALISGGLNSKLSNRDCSEKKEYHNTKEPVSLKYELMLSESVWNENTIVEHGKLMSKILIDKSDGYFEDYEDPLADVQTEIA